MLSDNYAYIHLSTLHFTSYCTCGGHSPERLATSAEFFKWSHHILKSCFYELCLLICFPDSEWWTEWRCRAAALRAAKWGRIPGTQWHLLRCKTLLLLSFMERDLLFFRWHKARDRGPDNIKGRKEKEDERNYSAQGHIVENHRERLTRTPPRDSTSFPLCYKRPRWCNFSLSAFIFSPSTLPSDSAGSSSNHGDMPPVSVLCHSVNVQMHTPKHTILIWGSSKLPEILTQSTITVGNVHFCKTNKYVGTKPPG